MACKTQLSLPSCFPRVLLSCCHVFGISVTLKLQNELARSRSLHYWCRCCPEWPMVRSLGWGRGWRVEGEGARLCLRGKQGAGQREGACECGDREFRETPPLPQSYVISYTMQPQLDASAEWGKQEKGWGGDCRLVPLSLPPRDRVHRHLPGPAPCPHVWGQCPGTLPSSSTQFQDLIPQREPKGQ